MERTYLTPDQAGELMVGLGFDPGDVIPGERWFLVVRGGPMGALEVVLGYEPCDGSSARMWDGIGFDGSDA